MTVKDERGPGLDFTLCLCVCGSCPWGAAALLSLCVYLFIEYC